VRWLQKGNRRQENQGNYRQETGRGSTAVTDPKVLGLLRAAIKRPQAISAATAALTEKGLHDTAAEVTAAFAAVKEAVKLLEADLPAPEDLS